MSQGDHRLYLYEDIIGLVVNTNGLYVDNRPMNNRKLIAHKGMYNQIKFDIRNRDRKLQNVFSESLSATLINPTTRRRIFTKLLEHTSDIGQVKLVLDEGDLRNVDEGLYTIYVSMTKADGNEYPVYADQNSSVKFQIEIDTQLKHEPVETQLGNTFTQVASTDSGDPANIFTTSALFGNQDRNFSHALHSIAVYPSAYTGNLTIQGSCIENTPNSDEASTDWFNIESNISLSASSDIYHKTFTVNANWIRVIHTPESGTINQILIRN